MERGAMMLRVLIACEFSGVVRNAFVAAGHDAFSCDLLPSETERPDGWDGHYRGDIFEFLEDEEFSWDLLIAHPACTFLTNSGIKWLYDGGKKKKTGVGPPPEDPKKRRAWAKVHRASPGPNRWKERSRTLPGIAKAMAEQWGGFVAAEIEKKG